MLLSAVIRLRAAQPAAIPATQGRALQAAFLRWVQEADTCQAQRLHDENGLKPYTVSNLFGAPVNRRGEMLLVAGQEVWWRVTSLSTELTTLLEQAVLPELQAGKQPLVVGEQTFEVLAVYTQAQEHPWACRSDYAALAQQHLLQGRNPPLRLSVEFASPTTMHSHGMHVPFPLPELALGSWLQRWNAHAPLSLPEEARTFAREGLALSRYRLHTRPVRFGERLYIGFVGQCTFQALLDDLYWLRLIHLLAAFSFYCGTGQKTTIGLGQTRPIDHVD
jgi:CRISPR-associated endoribonuclease Cas6